MRATAVQAEAARHGFDWPNAEGVLEKIAEELSEIREALEAGDLPHARKELGDLLLAAVNLARFLNASPAEEVAEATARFERRFQGVLSRLESAGREARSCTLDELEALWQEVKQHERQ